MTTPPRPRVWLAHPGWDFPYVVTCEACPACSADELDPEGPSPLPHTIDRSRSIAIGVDCARKHLAEHHSLGGAL